LPPKPEQREQHTHEDENRDQHGGLARAVAQLRLASAGRHALVRLCASWDYRPHGKGCDGLLARGCLLGGWVRRWR
jgi:hypothetical protein